MWDPNLDFILKAEPSAKFLNADRVQNAMPRK